ALLEPLALDRVANRPLEESVLRLALHEVLLRPDAHGLERDAHVAVRAENDDGRVLHGRADALDGLGPVRVGQAQIEQHDVELVRAEELDRLLERAGERDRVLSLTGALREHLAEEPGVTRLILHQEDAGRAHREWVGGRRTIVNQNSSIDCTTRMNWS